MSLVVLKARATDLTFLSNNSSSCCVESNLCERDTVWDKEDTLMSSATAQMYKLELYSTYFEDRYDEIGLLSFGCGV